MIVLTITPRKKRIRDLFIKRELSGNFSIMNFPRRQRLPMSQQIGMHEAYRIARSCGYKKDQPVSYQVMTAIVASAYQKGKEEAGKKPHS